MVAATEVVKGKPAYMSPEQATGKPLDGRSDLFSVGVMLWEMLCRRSLFQGFTAQETISRLLFMPIPSPSQVRSDIPEDLSRVVLSLLARDRAQRTPNAAAAIAQLIACADHPRHGRELLIQTLAARFAGRAMSRADRSLPPPPAERVRAGVPQQAPPRSAGDGPRTLTEPPYAVLGPVAPPVPRPRRARRPWVWLGLASFVIAGLLVGGGIALPGGCPNSTSRAASVDEHAAPAPPATHAGSAGAPEAPKQLPDAAAIVPVSPMDLPRVEARVKHDAAIVPRPLPKAGRSDPEHKAASTGSGGIREIPLGEPGR